MIATVKARYSDGVLTPLEPLDLEDGSEVTVSIDDASPPRRGLAGIVESVKRLQEAAPPDTRDDLPADPGDELEALPVRSSEGKG